ncbi:hypothetical protein EYF80_049983 [Liparis tanakae]|uniref:Uncharacterized protein n=1 Tax=Liparis tanakae TaxID=230148 RepID=A0A4Z2FHQ9_9TELE|nr:hypothetical protein EYF80_049983 [Liparis tanakae]
MSAGATGRGKKEQPNVKGDTLQKAEAGFLQWEAAPQEHVHALLASTRDQLQLAMPEVLGLRNHLVCMKESILLDYYVQGFWWAKEADFTPTQTSFTMAVLHMLLGNIREKQMSFMQNLREFAVALGAASQSRTSEEDTAPLLNQEEAMALITYIRNRSEESITGSCIPQSKRCGFLTGKVYKCLPIPTRPCGSSKGFTGWYKNVSIRLIYADSMGLRPAYINLRG